MLGGRFASAVCAIMGIMRASVHEDRIALALFERCQQTGQPVTLGAAEKLVRELRRHRDCGCGLCGAAAMVKPRGVHRVAQAWARGIAATRRRAGA